MRRSRSTLKRAAVELVSERGTTAISISDIAEAADVSRQLVYQQFGDRDTLLLEAALELARGELLPGFVDAGHPIAERDKALEMAQHFANHRAFYRAMLTGSCAFAFNKALSDLLIPFNARLVHQMSSEQLDPRTVEDLATFLTGGAAAVFNTWVVEGENPLDPKEFADRLMRMAAVVIPAMQQSTMIIHDKERDR